MPKYVVGAVLVVIVIFTSIAITVVGGSTYMSQIPQTEHAKHTELRLQSDSLAVQIAAVAAGAGVALVPEPSVRHFGLSPVKITAALREAASEWPVDELYLVTHRALRDVPRVRAVWDLILARWGERRGAKELCDGRIVEVDPARPLRTGEHADS